MKAKTVEKKRKARDDSSDSESDDELGNGLFDGVLDASEDEGDYIPSDEIEEDESGSENDGSDGSDEEDDDALLSDDIPSDNEDLSKMEDLEIAEPGVDPKRTEADDEGRNYRIEKDANGGERYVYECVISPCSRDCRGVVRIRIGRGKRES